MLESGTSGSERGQCSIEHGCNTVTPPPGNLVDNREYKPNLASRKTTASSTTDEY